MRIAAIDIGTNTVLLLIADVSKSGEIVPVHFEQRLPRLGMNVDANKVIHASAFERIEQVLAEYNALAVKYQSERTIACATSAVRDARNRSEFIEYLHKKTGLTVEVISGDEEARLTYRGAISGITDSGNPTAVIDIGGGSTELTYPLPGTHNGSTILKRYSFQIGSVRLTERYCKHDPPLIEELQSARQYILEELSEVRNPGFDSYRLVGVAGTVTTLACLDQQLTDFDVTKVSGYVLQHQTVVSWLRKLSSMASKEITALSYTTKGRADILTAGILILHEIMNHFRFTAVQVSERGLRYGIVLREWEKAKGQ